MKKLLILLLALSVTIFLVGFSPKTVTKIETVYEYIEVDRIVVQTQYVQMTQQERDNVRTIIESQVTIRLENELNHIKYDIQDDYDMRLQKAIDELEPRIIYKNVIVKEIEYIESVEYVNTVSTRNVEVLVPFEDTTRIDELVIELESLRTEYSGYQEEHRFSNAQFQDTANGLMVVITRLQNEIAELKG